jgi:hypothetical protein
MVTADGHPIVYAKPYHKGEMGRGWVVLCYLEHNELHPWVTWWMDVDGHTFSGDYCATIEEAIKSWEERK